MGLSHSVGDNGKRRGKLQRRKRDFGEDGNQVFRNLSRTSGSVDC
jgi:hypothetical protein